MKIIPIGQPSKTRKVPAWKNREALDRMKELIVTDHNKKLRAAKAALKKSATTK